MYKSLPINFNMNDLQNILSESKEPLFILDEEREIYEINETVISACASFDPTGKNFDTVVPMKVKTTRAFLAYFNNDWFRIDEEPFHWDERSYTKVALRRIPAVPDLDTMLTVRNMIAVLANRLRSPLTGMHGYLDILLDTVETNSERLVEKIRSGLDQLLEIIDELEYLYNIDSSDFQKHAKEFVDPEALIKEVLFTYPIEIQNRIKILKPEQPSQVHSNPYDTKVIFKQLIDNAIEHSPDKESKIVIDLCSPQTVKISNSGKPIPPSVRDKLYFPFVTTKASSIGIGLTIAQLLAKWQDGIIYLSTNNAEDGITFSFTVPQVSKVSQL